MRRSLVAGALIDGDVEVDSEGRIADLGLSPAAADGLAAPGFVDLTVNGFRGVDFLTAAPGDYERAEEGLAATGVTAYQPTLITSAVDDYWDVLSAAAEAKRHSVLRLLGVHLEGPFLSPEWPGAHNPDHIVEPDLELARKLCDGGPVSYMTLAPERPGALELIEELVADGLTVACGHSDADAPAAHAGFDRGVRTLTHIYNAHRRFTARDPGPAGVALTRPDVFVQAIVDNVHLAPETAYSAYLAASDRFVLVSDSIAAAGLGDGEYNLGDRRVNVHDGEARLPNGTLAGSVLTMDLAVRNLVELGAPLEQALLSASARPAQVIANHEIGELRKGRAADVVVLDDDLSVVRTLVGGREVFAR